MKLGLIILISALLMSHSFAFAEVKLPRIFGDNMVLQREMPVPIWGWAEAEAEVTLTLLDGSTNSEIETKTVVADEKGNWRTELQARPAGGPYTQGRWK
ncbi:hypothetical protein F4083_10490 [Candidatus Poribacteria bacterium]|nr:hypothetical protein [Candidatus Poribacteria bacterium]MYI94729.1 hypothetical protein [Candidatus Poribacteria bacterium]